ncbi:nuclear pore complex assembly-domain-containing protein [Boletus coccyginus]|nr:nuclear pore complex assembly-domain-containing protein [Boletus coccyginus]
MYYISDALSEIAESRHCFDVVVERDGRRTSLLAVVTCNADFVQDYEHAAVPSTVDDWLARFSPLHPGTFPFTSHKIQSIESRRASMSDLLILDVLLIRGGIHSPDMLFPPADRTALRKLLDAIDQSVYDILKKDCLVYILLKWAWDTDPKATNPGWDARYLQDRCIAPQFAALADAYWLLDTGTHLPKAVSILSDARLNRDYVSKILQALALSSSPASFASGTATAIATLIVKYVRTAKPLLTEPDDIDLYALSLVQLSFMDAWAYQKSFPEGSDTRERLLAKIVGWCLMPTPKKQPLAHLLAFPLSPFEQSSLYALALPSQFSTSSSLSSVNMRTAATPSGVVLSSQAVSILQDLLCVRAIQSGDYVGAIKLDRQFSSVSPSLGSGASSSSIASQATSSGRDTIDRKSIIQDLFATLPPAERTLLEDEIGKVATGVRANASLASTPRLGASATRRPLAAESSLSTSWEDVGAGTGSPAPPASLSSSAIGAGFASKATLVPMSATSQVNKSPLASRVARPHPASGQVPPTPKFTAFGSPIPPTTGVSKGRAVITERGKTLFSTAAVGGPSAAAKPVTHVSLFDTTGSAKNAPNAFYKPPSAPAARASLDVGSALASSSIAKSAGQGANTARENGKAQGGEGDGEDVSMGSGSDVEVIEEVHRDESSGDEQDEEAATDEDEDDAENFITYDNSGTADLTLDRREVDEILGEDDRNESLSMSVNSTTTTRRHAPPGAFHHEDDDEDKDNSEKEHDRVSQTTPLNSPRRSTRTRMQAHTPPRPSASSQPHRSSKSTTTTTSGTSRPVTHMGRTCSGRPSPNRTLPGALMDEDNDEHDMDHAGAHGDEDSEVDEEQDDLIAPLPPRPSRRRTTTTTAAKGKAKARPSEVKTPARRSSRLSTASSLSPDHTEVVSPTKKGRKSVGSRASAAGSGGGAVATRSSVRRKR